MSNDMLYADLFAKTIIVPITQEEGPLVSNLSNKQSLSMETRIG